MTAPAVRLVVLTGLIALLAGAAISLLAFYVARYGPSGDGWSFKGNGALSVYAAFPGVLAGGWTALALHARGRRNWLWTGAAAGVAGLLLALIAAAVLPVLGPQADQVITPMALIALVLWMLVAPVLAAMLGARVPIQGAVPHATAGAVWLIAAVLGLVLAGIAVPAGS
jgi:hypothetical protein